MASVIFWWGFVLIVLISIVNAFSLYEAGADRVVSAVLAFDRSERVMQCGLCILLMILCRFLRNCWRQHVFGIALGFGIFACIEMVLVESTLEIEEADQLSALNVVLVGSTEAEDPGFISMVERMADRVLSRHPWPRPAVQGSQIVGRKPQPEERN